ncbi:MAG: hypothetical protein H0W96_00140 [Solirubrobacterales bacterium]|nr:hypothetical protein [Solirubrobacterales bacterium]
MTRRALLAAVLFTGLLAPTTAGAHPLGNFTINHLTQVSVGKDAIALRYILDIAEIPTFQARHLSGAQTLSRARAEIARGLEVRVDGRRVTVQAAGIPQLSFPAGQGGLKTTRIELPLRAVAASARRVEIRDRTYAGRLGYTALVAKPGDRTAVRSSVSSQDPTDGLRRYPATVIARPLAQRSATLTVQDGSGTLLAPRYEGSEEVTTRYGTKDGFAAVFEDATKGNTTLLLLLLAALSWGALHALSPGHGKAMVAAYLIGTRGTSRHAIVLGAVVTITHTIGVFALGLITLLAAQYIVPEDLFPWLKLISGLLVVAIGAAVLRSRWHVHRARQAHEVGHRTGADQHSHAHTVQPSAHAAHDHAHAHAHGALGHSHESVHHRHHPPDTITWKGLIGMGASAGLIPCPSALVVLLGAIAQHEIALGLLLIVAFSIGLAGALTALGLLVVHARHVSSRISMPAGLVSVLPAASALVIVALGCALTIQAAPDLL